MKIVVGLGNPGKEYAGTRHNVGFDVVDEVALRLGWLGKAGDFDKLAKKKFEGLAFDGMLGGGGSSERVLLLKPMTYMNDSGRSVLAAMQFYQAAIGDVLVVLDDLALPCGALRLRGDGSSGGHNGLKDIERVLGSDKYPRLRFGIDAPPARVPGRDYVLQRFSEDQRKILDGKDGALGKAGSCAVIWAERGLTVAMNQFNVKESKSSGSGPGRNAGPGSESSSPAERGKGSPLMGSARPATGPRTAPDVPGQ